MTDQPDYSQFGEQQPILEWAARVGCRWFLDLGAYDGETFSNTAALADGGCPGLMVEAAPDQAAKCAERHAGNPGVRVACGAFSLADPGPVVELCWTPGQPFSSRSATWAGRSITPLLVPVLPLAWLADQLAAAPRPMFCSIDLEGDSLDALAWILELADPPELLCVETNDDDERRVAVGTAMGCPRARYDELHRTDVNQLLVAA